MKKFLLNTSIVLLLLMQACQKDVYDNIDKNTKILLKVGDTLIYNSALRADTFLIWKIVDGYNTRDNIYHTEYYEVDYQKLNYNSSEDSIYGDKFGYYIYRTNVGTAEITWRNLWGNQSENKDTIIQVGNMTFNNVQPVNNTDAPSIINHYNDIIKVYYTDLYGVIEYKRFDGEVFILNSKCVSKYIK